MLVYIIIEACIALKHTKISEDICPLMNELEAYMFDKTGGANNFHHDCIYSYTHACICRHFYTHVSLTYVSMILCDFMPIPCHIHRIAITITPKHWCMIAKQ